jgi:proline iminopeptidase
LLHIQNALEIPSWILFGGSWGATVALLYAEAWPERVAGMVLRGTFLARREDLDWFIGPQGVRRRYPEAWAAIPEFAGLREASEIVGLLHAGIHSKYAVTQWRMASAWEQWGAVVTLGDLSRERVSLTDERAEKIIQQSRIELHYAHHHYFIRENQILEAIDRVSQIPAVIIHGQKDLVCPWAAASQLHQLMPLSRLCMLENSAHIPTDTAMIAALVQATEEVADIGFKGP